MADGRTVAGFFRRAFERFGALAEALEETEFSTLERRVARLERESARAQPTSSEDTSSIGVHRS